MEEALCRIAFAFEQIANSLERIEVEGLDVNLSGLQKGPLSLKHEFSDLLPISVYPPSRAQSK